MKSLILIVACFIFTGCATSFFQEQKAAIEQAYQAGEITKAEELKLKNELFRTVKEGEETLLVYPMR